MLNNIYTRAGEAFDAGAPLGAAWDVAKTTQSNGQAATAGQAFFLANNIATGITPTGGELLPHARETAVTQWADRTEEQVNTKFNQAMFAMNTPLRLAGDFVETNTRYAANAFHSGNVGEMAKGALAFTGGLSAGLIADPKWREEWVAAQKAEASPAQTMWLAWKSFLNPDATTNADDPFLLIDSERLQADEDEYFSSGIAHWTTGAVDLAFNIFADPLLIAGKVVKGTRLANSIFGAEDVASVAGKMNDGVVLTRKQERLDSLVTSLVNASEEARNLPGGQAALYRGSRFGTQGADRGAMVAWMHSADQIADDAVRTAVKRDGIIAGMGNRTALLRLEEQDKLLALELRGYLQPNRDAAIQWLRHESGMDPLDVERAIHDDTWLSEVTKAHEERISQIYEARDALHRVHDLGSPAGVWESAGGIIPESNLGEINTLPGSVKLEQARIGYRVRHANGLPVFNVLFGRKLPQMVNLDADDFFESFSSAVAQTSSRKVRQAAGLDDEMRSFLDRAAMTRGMADPAAARAQRRAIVDEFVHVQTQRMKERHSFGDPVREEQIDDLIRTIRTRRNAQVAHLQERVQQAVANDSEYVHLLDDADQVYTMRTVDAKAMVATPFAGTQLDNMTSIPDFAKVEAALKTKFSAGFDGFMRKGASKTWEFTEEGLNVLSDLWKFSALLRPGYPLRNLVDSQARNLAMLGAEHVGRGAVSGFYNAIKNGARVNIADAERWALIENRKMRLAQIDDVLRRTTDAATRKELTAHIDDLKTQIASIESSQGVRFGKFLDLEEELKPLQARYNQMRTSLRNGGDVNADELRFLKSKIAEIRKELRGERVRVKDTVRARHIGMDDPNSPWFVQKFGASRQDMPAFVNTAEWERAHTLNDFKDSIAGLTQSVESRYLGEMRTSGLWQPIGPGNPNYNKSFLDLINKRVRGDDGLMAYIAGGDATTLRDWYLYNPKGSAIWKDLEDRYASIDEFIAKQMEQADLILQTPRLKDMAMAGPLTESMIAELPHKPIIPSEMLETVNKTSIEQVVGMYEWTRSQWFKWAGEIPEEMLSRNPFFAARKSMHLRRVMPDTDLTVSQINQLRKRADILARRDVSTYLFDTAQRSNLGAHLRFIMPFYAAWSDTMRKWMRIAGYNPASLVWMNKAFMSFNSGGFGMTVVDNDGNQILPNGNVVDAEGNVLRKSNDPTEGNIIFPIPDIFAGWLGSDSKVAISKSALNVTFQGEPFWLPSSGPLATMPVNWVLQRAFTNEADSPIIKYLLPFGVEANTLGMAAPMWLKNAVTLLGQSDSRFNQTYVEAIGDQANRIRNGEVPPMTEKELQDWAANKARNQWILRFLSNWGGATVQAQSKLEFYRNEFHRFRREYGKDAEDKFIAAYPEYQEAMISLSANEAGIAATDDTWRNSQLYRHDIERNKKYGWAYVGGENLAPGFSDAVYTAQQVRGWRTKKDPMEAYADLRVSEGWREYQRVSDALNAQLQARKAAGGHVSITAQSNADLKRIRDEFVAGLKGDNRYWADAFEQGGSAASVNEFFRWAEQAVTDRPELAKRSDFLALGEYYRVRAMVREQLDLRGLASIESAEAADLREIWEGFVQGLVADDLGFEQMYNRVLQRDTVARGVVSG